MVPLIDVPTEDPKGLRSRWVAATAATISKLPTRQRDYKAVQL